MSEKVLLTVKTDKKLKLAAQKVAKQMGVPLGTIINSQLRQVVSDKSYTFGVPLVPNKRTAARIRSAIRDFELGRNMVGPFKNAKEAIAHLDSLKK